MMSRIISHALIRTDASTTIGTGHVMRMLVLAQQLAARNIAVTFICAELKGHLIAHIKKTDFDVITCPTIEDTTWSETISHPPESTLLIIDHYKLSITYESQMIERGYRLMAVDDLARAHNSHYLLDSSVHINPAQRYEGKIPEHTAAFLGPDYALVNPDFAASARQRQAVNHLLVCMGGTDPQNKTAEIIEGLRDFETLTMDVVIGANHPDPQGTSTLCGSLPNATLHIQANHMVELMTKADLAILSGGVTLLEALANRLPVIGVCLADNQRGTLETLAGQKHIYHADDIQSIARIAKQAIDTPRFSPLTIGGKLDEMIGTITEDTP